MRFALPLLLGFASVALLAQTEPAQTPALKTRPEAQPSNGSFTLAPGTRILLSMINSVSTKHTLVGDRIYLETAFPVLSGNKIVIPQGSWVVGTVTEVKRPARVKGRGELRVRFDSLTLPNGVSRDFRADLGSIDSRDNETLKRENGKVEGPGDKKGDAGTVLETTSAGTVIGTGIGAAAHSVALGAGIGVGAGAAAGLIAVLLTRGPDATLNKGASVEMVLDRSLTYQESELDFSNVPPRAAISDGNRTTQPRRGLFSRIP